MKFLKVLGIIIVSIIVIGLIAAAILPKDQIIEKEIVINKPSSEVFAYIKNLKNQDLYGYWFTQDPQMKKEYRGTDGTIGFTTAWESEKMGVGEQEITGIDEGKRVDFALRFKKPFEANNKTWMTTEAVGPNQTKVKWGFSGHSNYPMNLMSAMMQGMLEDQFQTGLNNLKAIMEK